jgi:predicted amidohydrolase
MNVRVACRQLAPRVGDLDGNRALSVAAIRDAVAKGAEVVVLPELVTSGYVFASREEAASVAITADDSLFAEWASEVDGVRDGRGLVVGGFCERGDDGNLYNSAAVVGPSGVQAVYRKLHLWDREKLFFSAGDQPPPVLDTPVGRIGVMICYDLEFPEMARMLALQRAELIAVPTNWPRATWPAGEHPPEVVIAMATARTNRLFIACCDRTGTERGHEWTAGTSIIDEAGWVRGSAGADGGLVLAELDLAGAQKKRLTEFADVLADRRPEMYGGVVEAARDKAAR